MRLRRNHAARLASALLASTALFAQATPPAYAQIPATPTNVSIYPGSPTAPNATVTVSPATVTVQPGGTVQFTATVAGTPNTSVVWTATGGSVNANGTYTAGPTAGSFRVTATLKHGSIAGFANVTVGTSTTSNIQVAPGQNIQNAINSVPDGAVILLKAGIHRMQTVRPKANQTIVGEAGATMSGARVLTSFTRSGTAWVASGQTQQAPVYTDSRYKLCRPGFPRCNYPEDLYINDKPLVHVASLSAGGPGKWFFDYGADKIYFWDDPTGKVVETSVTSQAIVPGGTGVKLRNLIVEKYATVGQADAVQLGSGWIIEDSEVRLNHFGGIGSANDTIARRNKVHNNGCFGFHGPGSNVLVENNEISYNGYAGWDPYWGAGGSKWVHTRNLTVRNNNSHHNLGPGFWTDIDNIYTLYERNTVEDNERAGIFHEISYDAVIRYNTARRNGMQGKAYPYWTTNAGIEVVSSRNVEVYGNTLEDNWQGITGLEDHRGSGSGGVWTLINFNVHDNTITSKFNIAGGGRTGVIDTSGTAAFSSTANNRFRNNTYHLGTAAQYFVWAGADRNETQWKSYGHDTTGMFYR